MSPFDLPVRRPVATAMFFVGVLIMGAIAWQRIPVELLPPASGEELYVSFTRPGSEPEIVEREILLPLEARTATLPDVDETWAEITGASGTFRVRFRSGVDLQVRELDMRRLAAELQRDQPFGTRINVSAQDLSTISRFAMFIQVTGMDDRNTLLDFVDERITPRLGAVEGIARVQTGGGEPRELTVTLDPDRCAALNVQPEQVSIALARAVQRLHYLGNVDSEAGRASVILDGRPRGIYSLGETRIVQDRPVLLRHVADIDIGTGRELIRFRVNGQPTVGLVLFQEDGANLVRLGRSLRTRLEQLREEFAPFGVDFVINFDAAELVEVQLNRLKRLASTGFVIAMIVLYLFLRQWRAVGVVAVAVPASLLTALGLLFMFGQSLNLITLFGLAVGIGMLVDNSIVVYEAVQRQLEHGVDADEAAVQGVRRTVRAIFAATLTNAVVFLPIMFVDIDQAFKSLLEVMALAILLPMVGSVLVAVGLVPLLARRLAAPAALARVKRDREFRERSGGRAQPERVREVFIGILTVALRRPGVWVSGITAAVLLTIIVALPLVTVSSVNKEPPEENPIRIQVEIASGGSLDRSTGVFDRLEHATMALNGVRLVESVVREDSGALTVHLVDRKDRPDNLDATRVRSVVRQAAADLQGVEILANQGGFGGGGGGGGTGGGGGGGISSLLGQGQSQVILSGPEARTLNALARDIESQLESLPEVEQANVEASSGQEELRVIPDEHALQAYGLTADQVLPALNIVRREGVVMQVGFTQYDGREIPLTVRREPPSGHAIDDLRNLRLATAAGILPLAAIADVRRMPASSAILHHDGRREVAVAYTMGSGVPTTGSARLALDDQIGGAIQNAYRPPGYTIETPSTEESYSWFKKILLPVLLLLFAVLAVTFESLTLPLLVLISLPLTMFGATWALVISNTPGLDPMVLMGVLALIGLTVNPAILLVDRMQQRVRLSGMSAGAAALAAVRERARPILMTSATSIAGLWPLALVTGEANEIWPPFATVVMGGLVASTLLTLLAVPVGFVFLRRLDSLFGRLGPWVLLGWVGATIAIVAPLFTTGVLDTLTWQIVTTLLVASLLLGGIVLFFYRPEYPEPISDGGPPVVSVKYLRKVYGEPGPIGRAWRAPQRWAESVLRRQGHPFDALQARGRVVPILLVAGGAVYLATSLQTLFWQIVFVIVTAALLSMMFREIRRARGKADALGRVAPGGVEGLLATLAPWAGLGWITWHYHLIPRLEGDALGVRSWVPIAFGVILLWVQLGRRTAVKLSRGEIQVRLVDGRLRRIRSMWRGFSRPVFGLDLPREQVKALSRVEFEVKRGMVGILGPNGAGKTTLLRILAGILDPSRGTVQIGGVPLKKIRTYLARYIGYLPQDFGLPNDLSAREYLEYFALLYEIGPETERNERIERLLTEVGLKDRADEKIGSFSGGMRQRVAVARTLLRLPPIIIVDEPTVGLDPRERIRFRNLLSRLAEGRVVLFSTHVVEDVAVACERVIVFARGRMVFDGIPDDLASVADGRVWETTAPADRPLELPPHALVVDEAPDAEGRVRNRILSTDRPHESARPLPPSLEDGYLWLVAERSAG